MVRAEKVVKSFGNHIVLNGVDLSVKRGQVVVIIGPSGSGKTTLLNVFAGLIRPTAGNVYFRGRPIVAASVERAVVFQRHALLPWLNVAENIAFPLKLRGIERRRRRAMVMPLLVSVGLIEFADHPVWTLSGGMQQRVGLARAFATEAPILLMDEPFSALDPLIRTKLQDELLALQKTLKKTIVFVSHDLEEALKLGSHISIMEGGRIVQTGRPEDIVLRPANDYVREFIANVNPLSVLTAYNVMRDARDLELAGEGWVWLDRRKTTRFQIGPDRKVVAAERDKGKADWVACSEAEKPLPLQGQVAFWASPGTPLRTVMLAMHRADTAPVALFDENERFVGAIGVRDVLQAVLRRSMN